MTTHEAMQQSPQLILMVGTHHKLLGCYGDGGALSPMTTNSPNVCAKCACMDKIVVTIIGINGRMDIFDEEVKVRAQYPISLKLQPIFAYLNKPEGGFPITERVKRVISLPMAPALTRAEQESIVAALLTSSYSSSTKCA